MYVSKYTDTIASTHCYRPRTRYHATTATAHVLHQRSVEAVIHPLMATTAVDHPHVAIAPVVMITVVARLLLAMTITPVTAGIALPLLVRLVLLWTTHTHLQPGTAVMTLTPPPLVVVPTMTPMPPTDTTDLGRVRHQGLLTMDMTSVRRQDTGDCSFPLPSLQSGALGKGIPLMMIELSFLTAFFLPTISSTRSAISAGRQIDSKVAGSLRLDRMDALGSCCGNQ